MNTPRMARLTLVRLVAAALVLGWAAARPDALEVPLASLAVVAIGYAVLAGLGELGRRRLGRGGFGLANGLLVTDGLFLATAMYATGATHGPTGALVYLHVVAVTLLLGYRTGAAVAAWHSVLLLAAIGAQAARLLPRVDVAAGPSLAIDRFPVLDVTAFWLFALVTTLLAAMEERDARRRRTDAQARSSLAATLDRLAGVTAAAADGDQHAELPIRPSSELAKELRRAVDLGQLRLVFQPVVELESGRIAGLEALVRWHHPDHGPIAPGDFLRMAEQNGAILPVGRWVLRRACEQTVAWQAAGVIRPDTFVCVNVSGREIREAGFIGAVEEALAWSRIAPTRLVLEIAEPAFARATPATLDALETLRAIGVRVAIDDFGTGSLAVGQLRRIPVDALKIAGEFVQGGPDDAGRASLAEATVALGESFGIATVAEGIETHEQAERMRTIGCTYGQGYFFAPPITIPQIDEGVDGLATDHRWRSEGRPVAAAPRPRLPRIVEPRGQPSAA